MSKKVYEYDVALSFAGEERDYVNEVASFLSTEGVRVFYDEFESVALWGKDLYTYLDEIYRVKARFCVMFISRHYKEKRWANHERESAQARAFQENEEYILPARFDGTEIPGVRPTVGYLDLTMLSPEDLGRTILKKLGHAPPKDPGAGQSHRRPRLKARSFNPYDEALGFIEHLSSGLQQRVQPLASEGLSITTFDREGRKCFRFVVDGVTRYSLEVWLGGIGGDSSIAFYGVRGEMRDHSGSTNAWGEIKWSSEAGNLGIRLTDLSLLSHSVGDRSLTYDEFLDALWDTICDALELR